MEARGRDRIAGSILVAISVAWTWGVIETIPVFGGGIGTGAQGFPFGLGILLGLFGLMLLATSIGADGGGKAPNADQTPSPSERFRGTISAVGLLVAYGFLLRYCGFLIGTFAIVMIAWMVIEGPRKLGVAGGLAAGLALGVYLILGKILGVYLPYGGWINLAL